MKKVGRRVWNLVIICNQSLSVEKQTAVSMWKLNR